MTMASKSMEKNEMMERITPPPHFRLRERETLQHESNTSAATSAASVAIGVVVVAVVGVVVVVVVVCGY